MVNPYVSHLFFFSYSHRDLLVSKPILTKSESKALDLQNSVDLELITGMQRLSTVVELPHVLCLFTVSLAQPKVCYMKTKPQVSGHSLGWHTLTLLLC